MYNIFNIYIILVDINKYKYLINIFLQIKLTPVKTLTGTV